MRTTPIIAGADLEEMVTDFRNNKRRRRKVLGGTGGTLSREIFVFRVIHKNLTDFRKTVETGLDPRLHSTKKFRLNKRKRVQFICPQNGTNAVVKCLRV